MISIHLFTKHVLQQTHLIYAWTPQLQAILQESCSVLKERDRERLSTIRKIGQAIRVRPTLLTLE